MTAGFGLLTRWPPVILALTLLLASGPIKPATAQSDGPLSPATDVDDTLGTSGVLVPGGDFSLGIMPSPDRRRMDSYFTGRTARGIVLGSSPDPDNPDDGSMFWLEFGSTPTAQNGVSAQFGLGYSPSRNIGVAVGPFIDLQPRESSIYDAGNTSITPTQSRMRFTNSNIKADDAGIAASLSYMPFQDIWIGLHGRVSHNLSPTEEANDGILDEIDAMLGLTAGYRIEF